MSDPLAPTTRVLDALPCGAMLIDRAGRVVYANAKLVALGGAGATPLVGRNLLDIYAGTEAAAQVQEALAHFDEPRALESFVLRADRSRLPVMTWRFDPA